MTTHDIVARYAIRFATGAHYESIVRRDDGNDLGTFCFELTQVLDVGGKMSGLATRGEGT